MKDIDIKKYKKLGIMASVIVIVCMITILGISRFNKETSIENAISSIDKEAVNMADIRLAIIRMDFVQNESKVLKKIREQKEKYENRLRDMLTQEQKKLEKEKADIEKSQDLLAREALQRRVVEYQTRIANFQRSIAEKSQSIEMSFQKALASIQENHLDPLIKAIIKKKNLSLVIDGRFVRIGDNSKNLDITDDVVKSLDKRITTFNIEIPKGF